MTPTRFHLSVLGLLLAVVAIPAAQAQPSRELARILRHEAPITAERPELVRLPLTREVLAQCSGDLGDVRIFAADGSQVPYFIDSRVPPLGERQHVDAPPQQVTQHIQEREQAPSLHTETILLTLPAEPPASGAWRLMLRSDRGHFVRQIEVVASDESGAPGPALATGTVFRIPHPTRQRLHLDLPATDASHLLVTVRGEEGSFLEPLLSLESSREAPTPDQLVVPLREVRQEEGEGYVLLTLARPRGIVPDKLRIRVGFGTAQTFYRRFIVRDHLPDGSSATVGDEHLFRIADLEDVDDLEIELSPARGDELSVRIESGDGPPLSGITFEAVVRGPALVFEWSPGATLRYGGGRAQAPQYDLETLIQNGLARRLVDRGIPVATLSSPRANPDYDGEAALHFVMHPGTAVRTARYRHRRMILVPRTDEGLAAVDMLAAEMAWARADLADVRVVDGDDMQWPYLLERNATLEDVPLQIGESATDAGWTTYSLTMPEPNAPVDTLVLITDASFIARDYEILGQHGEEVVSLGSGTMTRPPERRAPIRLALRARRVDSMRLRVHDGDDRPLQIDSASVQIKVARLLLAASAGSYSVLVGYDEAEPPAYQIERARDLVLAVHATTVSTGPSGDNPAYTPPRRSLDWQGIALWVVLALAVMVLVVLTFRVARSEEPSAEAPTGAPGPRVDNHDDDDCNDGDGDDAPTEPTPGSAGDDSDRPPE